MTTSNKAAAILGALVADAAALGLHWIYDVDRIADITQDFGGASAFVPVDSENYIDTKAYFAHGARESGMSSQYGEVLALALKTIASNGGQFDRDEYQDAYQAHFGPGGLYAGYIDAPTRGTLANLANDKREPSGIDDAQLPALATLPALVAIYGDDALIKDAVEVTNVNDEALEYAYVFAGLLNDVAGGTDIDAALANAAANAPDGIKELLQAALSTDDMDAVSYGETTGRACYLKSGVPLAFHILKNYDSFEDAVEANILAGGDSAGRAIIVGSIMAAKHGIATQKGVPLSYILEYDDAAEIWADCELLDMFVGEAH